MEKLKVSIHKDTLLEVDACLILLPNSWYIPHIHKVI